MRQGERLTVDLYAGGSGGADPVASCPRPSAWGSLASRSALSLRATNRFRVLGDLVVESSAMPRTLKPSERLARAALEPHLGHLEPVEETTEHKTPDFRTVDESDAVEVKEMTSEDYQKITAVHQKMPTSWDLDGLTGRWTVIDLAPTMSDTHEPMPAFPEVDQATIDHYAAYGMRVKTVAEREADWHEEATRPRPQIRLHDLGPRLEPHLAVLEQEGDTEVDSYAIGRPEPVRVATAAIRGLIHGALCQRRDPLTEEQAGIDVRLGQGYVRTGRPDTIAQRVQLWLDRGGTHVTNLVETLELEEKGPAGTQRSCSPLGRNPNTGPRSRWALRSFLPLASTSRTPSTCCGSCWGRSCCATRPPAGGTPARRRHRPDNWAGPNARSLGPLDVSAGGPFGELLQRVDGEPCDPNPAGSGAPDRLVMRRDPPQAHRGLNGHYVSP
jgi:hypothetical protein